MAARTTSSGYGSPTPQAWLRRRRSWSSSESSGGIVRSTKRPKPVLIPYVCSPAPSLAAASTSSRAAASLRRPSSETSADAPSTATAQTSASVRSSPVSETAVVVAIESSVEPPCTPLGTTHRPHSRSPGAAARTPRSPSAGCGATEWTCTHCSRPSRRSTSGSACTASAGSCSTARRRLWGSRSSRCRSRPRAPTTSTRSGWVARSCRRLWRRSRPSRSATSSSRTSEGIARSASRRSGSERCSHSGARTRRPSRASSSPTAFGPWSSASIRDACPARRRGARTTRASSPSSLWESTPAARTASSTLSSAPGLSGLRRSRAGRATWSSATASSSATCSPRRRACLSRGERSRLLGPPAQAHGLEAPRRRLQALPLPADDGERPLGERRRVAAACCQRRSDVLDLRPAAERAESIDPCGREIRIEGPGDRLQRESALELRAVLAEEEQPEQGGVGPARTEHRARAGREVLEPLRLVLLPELRRRQGAHEERATVELARRLPIRRRGLLGALGEGERGRPPAGDRLHDEMRSDGVDAVMGSEAGDDALVLAGVRSRLLDQAEVRAHDRREEVLLSPAVGVAEAGRERQLAFDPAAGRLQVADGEAHARLGLVGGRAQRRLVEPLRDRRRPIRLLLSLRRMLHCLRREQRRLDAGTRPCELPGPFHPGLHDVGLGRLLPHVRPAASVDGEVGEDLGCQLGGGGRERLLGSAAVPLQVVLEHARRRRLPPELGPPLVVELQLERAPDEREDLVELETGQGAVGGPAEPDERPGAKLPRPLGLVRPREIDLLGSGRLGIVVRQQRSVLVVRPPRALEPLGEAGVEAGPAGGGEEAARGSPPSGRGRREPRGGRGPSPTSRWTWAPRRRASVLPRASGRAGRRARRAPPRGRTDCLPRARARGFRLPRGGGQRGPRPCDGQPPGGAARARGGGGPPPPRNPDPPPTGPPPPAPPAGRGAPIRPPPRA